jgi:CheY-like chemotaxis protein
MVRIIESLNKTLRDYLFPAATPTADPQSNDPQFDNRTMLTVENDPDMNSALGRSLKSPCVPFLVGSNDSIDDVLRALQAQCKRDYVIYIDAQLVYRECPDPSCYGGVELVKHIRLTPSFEPLSLLPVVLGMLDSTEWLLTQAIDNILILSPGCRGLRLPSTLSDLRESVSSRQGFADEQEMTSSLRPFILFSEGDERMRSHTYLNRAGVRKFLTEFAGVPEGEAVALQPRSDFQTGTWLKKLYFLRPELGIGGMLTSEEVARLRSLAAHQSVILIDDEHRRGWSFGLYSGLYGGEINPDVFRNTGSLIESPDKRMLCIDNFDSALDLMRSKAGELEDELNRWAVAESDELQSWYDEKAAGQKLRKAQQERESTQKQLQFLQRDLQQTEKKYHESRTFLKDALSGFGDLATTVMDIMTSPSGGDGISKILEEIPNLRTDTKHLSQAIDAYELAQRSHKETKERVTVAESALAQAAQAVSDAEKTFREARQQREMAATGLQEIEARLTEIFPYSMLFLDLRLVPGTDEEASAVGLSGIRLLTEIRELFPQLSVIVMTASEKALTAEKARELGADGYWIKGVSSGRQLMEMVIDCLSKAELRDLWLKVKMIEKKKEIHCFEWNRKELEPYTLQNTNLYRVHLTRWLEESLLLLQQTLAASSYSYNYVIFNMYLIQEIRIRLQKEDDWGQFSGQLPKEDQDLRKRRNDVAHARRAASSEAVKRDEALRVIRFTIEKLLKERHDR